jgi:hypothetical protein
MQHTLKKSLGVKKKQARPCALVAAKKEKAWPQNCRPPPPEENACFVV